MKNMQFSTIRNYIVYLRNIIFFKVIMVFFITLFLTWLMFVVKQDLKISDSRYNFIFNNILELEKNLDLISRSKNDLLDNYKKYTKYINISAQEYCEKRHQLIEKIKELGIKHNLNSKIDVNIIRSFKESSSSLNQLNINHYDCIIHFAAPSFIESINLANEIYAIIPENSIVTSFEVKEIESLNQEIIEKLTKTIKPDLIKSRIVINLQEINYFVK